MEIPFNLTRILFLNLDYAVGINGKGYVGFRDLTALKENGIGIKENDLGLKYEELTK